MYVVPGADARTPISERHETLKKALNYYSENHEIIIETTNT